MVLTDYFWKFTLEIITDPVLEQSDTNEWATRLYNFYWHNFASKAYSLGASIGD